VCTTVVLRCLLGFGILTSNGGSRPSASFLPDSSITKIGAGSINPAPPSPAVGVVFVVVMVFMGLLVVMVVVAGDAVVFVVLLVVVVVAAAAAVALEDAAAAIARAVDIASDTA